MQKLDRDEMMMAALGPGARACLAYIESFYQEHGLPPSMRQIAVGIGLAESSTQSVRNHLASLAEAGLVNRGEGRTARACVPLRRSL